MKCFVSAIIGTVLVTSVGLADAINCTVPKNLSGVTKISLVSLGAESYFTHMTVESSGGGTLTYEAASPADAITGFGPEQFQTSTFKGVQFLGYATIHHKFFTRPEEQSPTGWSPKTGVKIKIILPPAIEMINLDCIRTT